MNETRTQFEADCSALLSKFFAAHPDSALEARTRKALRLLRTSEKPLKGKANGWVAGALYFAATDGKWPSGVQGLLNADLERFMGVTMNTVRERAARIRELAEI